MFDRDPAHSTDLVGWRDDVPVIAARRDGSVLRFWCEHCEAQHEHEAEGHHAAACTSDASPFHASGYVIKGYA